LIEEISYKDGWRFVVDGIACAVDIHVRVWRRDVVTGEMGYGTSGSVRLLPGMSDGDILRKAFQLILGFEEHEVREHFKWSGRAIFGPHTSLEALFEAAARRD